MLEWLDRYMAKFAQTDHIRREEHARRQVFSDQFRKS